MATVLPWLEEAIGGMRIAELPSALGLADFGCLEAQNSIRAMQRVIAAIQKRSARPIRTIHHIDLSDNRWAALFAGSRRDAGSVFGEGVFTSAVAGSMLEPLLPPASVQVAMTFNALGLQSRRSEKLGGNVPPHGPSLSSGFGAAQASADLETFLVARAGELVPGGKLLVEVLGAGEQARTTDGIYEVLNAALLEVLEAGLVDRVRYHGHYQPIHARTLDELKAPVTPEGSLAPLFRLDRSATYEVEVAFVEAFRRTGDAAAFARSYTSFFRALTEPVLRATFSDDPDRVAHEVYQRAERLIRTDPDRFPFRYIGIGALMTRRDTRDNQATVQS
jgi:hypothetical protein